MKFKKKIKVHIKDSSLRKVASICSNRVISHYINTIDDEIINILNM